MPLTTAPVIDRPDDGGTLPAWAGPARDRLVELEDIFARMRTAAALRNRLAYPAAGLHRFPTVVITRRAWAAEVSHEPGLFPVGATWVTYKVRVGYDDGSRDTWVAEADGRFCVVVADDAGADVPPAEWQLHTAEGHVLTPDELAWFDQLPRSVLVPRLSGPRLTRSASRALYDGEAARGELMYSQRGLVHKVVGQYRRQLVNDAVAIDVEDLEQVALQRILELASRRYAGPASRRPSTAAWSKVAMREVGNAIKAEIAAITGISVEFRQLLSWFRGTPGDRLRHPAAVARDMAFAAGVTRLVQAHRATDRESGTELLQAMLDDGRAVYLPAGGDPELKTMARDAGLFVVAPRSSLAEIERAQRHCDLPDLALDAPAGNESDATMADILVADRDHRFDAVEVELFLEQTFAAHGLSELEADVWCARTGVHGGGADELPEIAVDFGLDGRAEARAALRRAWRKLSSVGEELRRAAA